MNLKAQHIRQFKQLYKKHFDIELTWDEAMEGSRKLAELVKILIV